MHQRFSLAGADGGEVKIVDVIHPQGVQMHEHRQAICGTRHTASWFQWCAMRIAPEYVECEKCKRLIYPMLQKD